MAAWELVNDGAPGPTPWFDVDCVLDSLEDDADIRLHPDLEVCLEPVRTFLDLSELDFAAWFFCLAHCWLGFDDVPDELVKELDFAFDLQREDKTAVPPGRLPYFLAQQIGGAVGDHEATVFLPSLWIPDNWTGKKLPGARMGTTRFRAGVSGGERIWPYVLDAVWPGTFDRKFIRENSKGLTWTSLVKDLGEGVGTSCVRRVPFWFVALLLHVGCTNYSKLLDFNGGQIPPAPPPLRGFFRPFSVQFRTETEQHVFLLNHPIERCLSHEDGLSFCLAAGLAKKGTTAPGRVEISAGISLRDWLFDASWALRPGLYLVACDDPTAVIARAVNVCRESPHHKVADRVGALLADTPPAGSVTSEGLMVRAKRLHDDVVAKILIPAGQNTGVELYYPGIRPQHLDWLMHGSQPERVGAPPGWLMLVDNDPGLFKIVVSDLAHELAPNKHPLLNRRGAVLLAVRPGADFAGLAELLEGIELPPGTGFFEADGS